MIWFTADPHFGHEPIAKNRGFTSEEHDELVLGAINAVVERRDRLIIAGDFCFRSKPGKWRQRINCREVILVFGNHDRPSFGQFFSRAEQQLVLKVGEHRVYVSHYPHAYWPASHHGSMHVYGHCHAQREETLDTLFPGRRSMDVGLDNAVRLLGELRPFSENEVVERLLAAPGHDPVSYYREKNGTYE